MRERRRSSRGCAPPNHARSGIVARLLAWLRRTWANPAGSASSTSRALMRACQASKAARARVERCAIVGAGASTASEAGEGTSTLASAAATASSLGEMTVRLMVEFLTPVDEEALSTEEEEEVSTTAECEPVVVAESSLELSADESTTIEWCPVDLLSARAGRMLTCTVESSMPPSAPSVPEDETSTMTEWSPRSTLRRVLRARFEPDWFKLMLTVELWMPPRPPAPDDEASMWMLWCWAAA